MAIEFHCGTCNKLLRTSDDKAGRRARCPECGESVIVPVPASAERPLSPPLADLADLEEESVAPPVTCPMCGATVSRTQANCPDCGEELRMDFQAGTTFVAGNSIAFGPVLDLAWRAFLRRPGASLAAGVILLGIPAAVVAGITVLSDSTSFEAIDFDVDRTRRALIGRWAFNPFAGLVIPALFLVISNWLALGAARFFLRLVRGRRASVVQVLDPEKRFGLGLFNLFIAAVCLVALNLVVGMGLRLFGLRLGDLVPIIFAVVDLVACLPFLCFYFVVVDRSAEGLGPLKQSQVASAGNYATLLGMALLIVALNLLGTLALIVGLIFTIPLSLLILASAYEQMTTVSATEPKQSPAGAVGELPGKDS